MLEPIADTFDIAPTKKAEVTANLLMDNSTLEMEVYSGNFISLWVAGNVQVKTGEDCLLFPEV